MRAMVLTEVGKPLVLKDLPIPHLFNQQVLIKVSACGVCRTDLHILDGELTSPKLPLILGHQIVGTIEKAQSDIYPLQVGDKIGVPWLGGSCGVCSYCQSGNENLCDNAVYTGYHIDGGFAEYCVADARFIFPIPSGYPDTEAAPLLCAGLIGYRSLKMTNHAQSIGFFGFGASAHLLIQIVRFKGGKVFAFTRPGDTKNQSFAKKLGAVWVGSVDDSPPQLLDAAIIFAPVGALVPLALRAIKKGGIVVCAGIHMSDIPAFPYKILWEERILRSVANLTRQDGEEFLRLAPKIPIKTEVNVYSLEQANQAIEDLRTGRLRGTAVLHIQS